MRKVTTIVAALSLLTPLLSHAQEDEHKITCTVSDFQNGTLRPIDASNRHPADNISSAMRKSVGRDFFKFDAVVYAWYDQDGRIFNAKLKESSGYPEIDSAIIDYAKSSHVTRKCGVGLIVYRLRNGA